MKTFAKILLCLALLTVSRAAVHAQETFAPLVSENCVAFVHIDFRKVELDTIKNDLQKIGEGFLKDLGFDNKSLTATVKELNVELDKLETLVRPTFDTITKELGIREVALIFDMELLMQNAPLVIALPWKNKTDKHLETLTALLDAMDMDNAEFIKKGDLLIVSPPWRGEEMTEWTKSVKPAPARSPVFEALKSVTDAEIKVAVALPEQVRTLIRNAPFPPDMPDQVKNLFIFAAQKVEWASASLSLANLLGKEGAKNADVLFTVKTPRRSDAITIQGLLEQSIELGVLAARFAAEQQMQGEEFQIPPLAFQFMRGFLRTLLPDVEEDKLIFRVKGNFSGFMRGQGAISVAGVAVALLLPAVQAAREAARRMQCANNIKQIVLALHNYHDALGALPPLYSVDANGKPLHSWRTMILPFIEQAALFDQIRFNEPWDSEHNKQFHNFVVPVYRCPSNPLTQQPGKNCIYSAVAGEGLRPAIAVNQHRDNLAWLADGTSNTLAVVEVKEPFCWMDPTADVTLEQLLKGINAADGRAGSFHVGGMNVGVFDGAVRFITNGIDKEVLQNFAKPNSGKSLPMNL
jgi:hypothetical protein